MGVQGVRSRVHLFLILVPVPVRVLLGRVRAQSKLFQIGQAVFVIVTGAVAREGFKIEIFPRVVHPIAIGNHRVGKGMDLVGPHVNP